MHSDASDGPRAFLALRVSKPTLAVPQARLAWAGVPVEDEIVAAASFRGFVRQAIIPALTLAALPPFASAAAVRQATFESAKRSSTGPSFVIRASSTLMRLGHYSIDGHPTYAGAAAALGHSDSCRLVKNRFVGLDRSHAVASWAALGVVIELRTYGSLPPAKTGCTAPNLIRVHTVKATDRRWRTSRGLRVGDSVSRLRQLSPSAKAAHELAGWYSPGYWLVTRHVGGYEGIGGLHPTAPVLVAETVDGRVTGFVFVVDAEGD